MKPMSELEEGIIENKEEGRRSSLHIENDLCGLRSPNDDVRKRSQRCWGLCCCFNILLILLTFLVIIPAIIRDIVHKSDLSLESTTISNPTDSSFTTTTVQRFSNAGSVSAKCQMNTLSVNWNHAGGGLLLKLTDSNQITVKNNADATLTSTAIVQNVTALADFNTYAMSASTMEWQLTGFADVTFIVTASVYINKKVTLTGYDNFPISPVVHYVNTTGGQGNQLYTVILATMSSPSDVNLVLGRSLYFHIMSEGINIGIGELPDYSMYTGSTTLLANCTLTYTNTEQYNQLMKVLANYSLGFNASVSMENFYTVPSISWLAPALSTMNMPSTLPGGTHPSVELITLYNQVIPENIPFTMKLYNQLGVNCTFTKILGSLYYEGTEIATVNQPNLHIVIPAHSSITTPKLTSDSVTSVAAITAFNKLVANGGGLVDTYNTLSLNISGFAAVTDYYQLNVTLVVDPIF